jgi:uncharacterized NAD(P)/FAD-binding protein YdhS
VPRVAIIGGGFSGAVTAINLARIARQKLSIDVIEPRAMLGGGVAYSSGDPAHRINVPASRMTVFTDGAGEFDRWVRTSGRLDDDTQAIWEGDHAFPRRGVFGRYIAELVAEASRDHPHAPIIHHRSTATDIAARPSGFAVTLASGDVLAADVVILAVSHPPPAVPGSLRAALAQGAPIIADPWRHGALDALAPDAHVLIVGTGLSMADIVASLAQRGFAGRITAVSRRGLLSKGHDFAPNAGWDAFKTLKLADTARGLLLLVREQVCLASAAGVPWQAVFDDVRAHGGRIWAALPVREQRRLVRHLRPYWDVHRFRIAPQAEAAIAALRTEGRLSHIAGSLLGATWDGGSLAVTLRPRRQAGRAMVLDVDAAVVTTGPAHSDILQASGAIASLARQTLIQGDPVGLGLLVDPLSRPVAADGGIRPDLFVAGPLARGRFGELMGLPQVSEHAAAVAQSAAAFLAIRVNGPDRLVGNDAAQQLTAAYPTL